jgi:uncharacterized protein YgiM (DUF1202 family)
MFHANRSVRRWLTAIAAVALLLSISMTSGFGRANAQDDAAGATPTAEATDTPTTEATEATDTSDSVTAADTSDADFAVGDDVEVADGPLNFREEAGTEADVITQFATGTLLTITDGPTDADDFTWYEVKSPDNDTGWVAGEFLAAASDGAFAEGDVVEVVDGPLNVREDSDISADVIMQLETGETASVKSGPVSADDYDWYEVEIDRDTTGWVAGEFLGLFDDSGDSGDADFEIGDGVRVAVDGLNFRADPGLDADVIDTLDLDSLMLVEDGPVSADGYTWYQVFNFYYGEGWVAGELVTLEPDGFPTEEGN